MIPAMTDRTLTNKQEFDQFYDYMSVLDMDQSLSFESMVRNYYTRNFASSGCDHCIRQLVGGFDGFDRGVENRQESM